MFTKDTKSLERVVPSVLWAVIAIIGHYTGIEDSKKGRYV